MGVQLRSLTGAFSNCVSLTSVVIPDSVTSIGSQAFYECDRLTYNIKDNVKYLGNNDNPYHAAIDSTSNTIKTLTIDNNCKVIADYAFSYLDSLTSVVIPDSVTSIGWDAFFNCTSLTNVYYTGTEEEWAEIEIGLGNVDLTSATIHYNYVLEG